MHWCLLLVSLVGVVRVGLCLNCRGEKPRLRDCDKVCNDSGECKIRAALLLPKNTTFDACLPAVGPVLDLAMMDPVVRGAFPPWLEVEWLKYDVQDCDAAYAVISAIDAFNDCAHVFFGPACDFALASVARITKFLGGTGTPVVTTGGFSFDFVKPKQTCKDEFYMLVRPGPLGFKDLGFFIIDVMKHFKWKQLLLINEPEAQVHVGGKSSCLLMMKSFANYLKKEEIIYTPWDTTSDAGLNYTENLKLNLGTKYTSKSICYYSRHLYACQIITVQLKLNACSGYYIRLPITRFEWGRAALIYDTPSFFEAVGASGGFLLASTIHEYMILLGFEVFGREITAQQNFTDMLIQTVGNNYASEFFLGNGYMAT